MGMRRDPAGYGWGFAETTTRSEPAGSDGRLRRLPLWRQVAVQQVVAELAGRVIIAHQLPEVVQPRVLAAQDLRAGAEQLAPVRPGPQPPQAALPPRHPRGHRRASSDPTY